MESKLKHLEIIQSVITRMATNSFLLKGWCITLVAALCALTVQSDRSRVYLLAYIPIILFSFLDAYYLWLERRFRGLYNLVRQIAPQAIDFSMNTAQFAASRKGYLGAYFSITVIPFYVVLAGSVLLVGLLLKTT